MRTKARDKKQYSSKVLFRVITVVMCIFVGYFGSIVCNLRAMAYAEQKEAREHIQVITKNHVEDYLSESSGQTGTVRETIFKEADVDAVAKKAAKIVTDKLINGPMSINSTN